VRGLLRLFVVSPIFTGAISTGAPEPAGALP
jgi:hypothetical protein